MQQVWFAVQAAYDDFVLLCKLMLELDDKWINESKKSTATENNGICGEVKMLLLICFLYLTNTKIHLKKGKTTDDTVI